VTGQLSRHRIRSRNAGADTFRPAQHAIPVPAYCPQLAVDDRPGPDVVGHQYEARAHPKISWDGLSPAFFACQSAEGVGFEPTMTLLP